jgi:capsular polysaccharide biosynthesis protein
MSEKSPTTSPSFDHLDQLRVPREVLAGDTLDDFGRIGALYDRIDLAEASQFARAEFFFREQFDQGMSPFGCYFGDQTFRQVCAKSVSATKLEEVVLLGGDGVILHNRKAVYDTLFDIAPWHPKSIVAQFEQGKSLLLKNEMSITRRLPGGIYLVGFNGCWTNYAHWMQQMLPWLVTFTLIRERVPGLRIIVPEVAMTSFHNQTLRLLGILDHELAPIRSDEVVVIPAAFLVSRIDLWSVSPYLRIAAEALSNKVPSVVDGAAKIYIHRRTAGRQLVNFHEIEPLLVAHGFTVVEFEDMPVTEQIALMRNARYVIGEHGAGLINIIFCLEDAQVLELFNPVCVQPEFWSVASVCRLGYGFLVGEHHPTESYPNPDWNSAYYVDPGKLDIAIRALLLIPER